MLPAYIVSFMLDLDYINQLIRNEKGVLAFPTDTLFALACDATSEEAIRKLFAVKRRHVEKTAPILVSSLEMAQSYVYFNEVALQLACKYWPGALTLVLPVKQGLVAELAVREGTIGVRVPGDDTARAIIQHVGVPLVGTSANLADGPNLLSADEIEQQLGVYVVKTGATTLRGIASTIAAVDAVGKITIIRQGAVSVCTEFGN